MTHTILIIGAGGHGQVVADILLAQPGRPERMLRPIGFLDESSDRRGNHFFNLPILGSLRDLAIVPHDGVIVAVEHNLLRRQIIDRLLAEGEWVVPAIHPSALIGTGVTVGAGAVIGPGAVVNTGAGLGRGVIVNSHSTIDHHVRIGDFAHICPGAHLCAHATVGSGVFVGAGAIITPWRQIGPWSVVPAGSIVVHDLHSAPAYLPAPAW
ncbi:MAG: NeuD/PglB/VioB family sugar acetyltransferase [Anaerolineaceae bacterium]|nr:NeuD/PglB/VioB family sugar acetyltransferase [Anaerolineaceae bacterium]